MDERPLSRLESLGKRPRRCRRGDGRAVGVPAANPDSHRPERCERNDDRGVGIVDLVCLSLIIGSAGSSLLSSLQATVMARLKQQRQLSPERLPTASSNRSRINWPQPPRSARLRSTRSTARRQRRFRLRWVTSKWGRSWMSEVLGELVARVQQSRDNGRGHNRCRHSRLSIKESGVGVDRRTGAAVRSAPGARLELATIGLTVRRSAN